jgi:hypothetical protein
VHDEDVAALLNRHLPVGGAHPQARIPVDAVRAEVGDDGIAAIDAWIRAHGGTVEKVPVSRLKFYVIPCSALEE